MTFIDVVAEDQAAGDVAAMYETDREIFGELPNLTRGLSLRPDVYAAWRRLNGAVKANMDLRRYELATLAAAARLRSSYCSLAHGSILREQFLSAEAVRAVMAGAPAAELDAVDAAVVALAGKVADDATAVTQADVDELRDLGLSDADVLDVVLAATVRCFFSKTLDALGIEPDAKYRAMEPELRDALTVGRPIAAS
ncbi:MAG: carboxymuconolactone decarboxylase family protein [Solirubrobacteraceae bacterium]